MTADAGDRSTLPTHPVRPRHAASLILLKGDLDSPEVLLGRRPMASRFMPGVYVFPGGALERGDHAVASALDLRPDVETRLAQHGGLRRARALTWTAIRETWEETGVMVGKTGNFEPTRTTPATQAFRDAGLIPSPACLDYIVRAITPTHSPIRFDTRFFLANGAKVGGSLIETKELEDIGWYSLAKALDQLKIISVTQFVLEEAWRSWRNAPQEQAERTPPVLSWRRGVRVIRRE
jgi:8-oxo-dGTP pyrophosphatase MutT (NUDIX family)